MPDDLQTVEVTDDYDADAAPLRPSELAQHGRLTVTGDMMGAVEIAEPGSSGVWDLRLEAGFATQVVGVVTVDDRLDEGTYALVRVDEVKEETNDNRTKHR